MIGKVCTVQSHRSLITLVIPVPVIKDRSWKHTMPSTRTQKPHHLKKRKKPGLMPQTKPLSPPPLHCHCPRATFNYHLGGQAIQHKRHARPGKKQRRSLSLALSSVRWLVGPKRSPSQVVSLYFGTDDNHSARHPASPEHQHHTLFPLLLYLVSVGKGETCRSGVFGLNVDGGERSPFFVEFYCRPPSSSSSSRGKT